jgi:hypothetical protein
MARTGGKAANRKASKASADRLREHLLELLGPGGAHVSFDKAVADLPAKLRGARPPNIPHSPWRLLEHMRIAQEDILRFTQDARHESPPWPEGYWPDGDAPPNAKAWDRTLKAYRADRKAMIGIVKDPATDLLAPLPHGTDQTVAREAMLLADHTAYHVGQLIIVRRALGAWEE